MRRLRHPRLVQVPNVTTPPHHACAVLRESLSPHDWEQLADAIRLAHMPSVERRGRFCIRHGRNALSQFFARLFRLPRPAEDIETSLLIVADADRESWQRSFAGKPFSTVQWADGGSIIEKWGCIEICFKPSVKDGCLHYEQRGAAFRAGPVRVPLPRWLAPRIAAVESPVSADSIQVSVAVTCPVIGLLIAYDGIVKVGQ